MIELTSKLPIDNYSEYSFDDSATVAVQKAYSIGIINGVGNNKFLPAKAITLEEFIAMLYRSMCFIGVIDEEITYDKNSEVILDNVSEWAKEPIGHLIQIGILNNIAPYSMDIKGGVSGELGIALTYRAYSEWNAVSNTHLPHYNEFETYNRLNRFPGLTISEVRIDDQLFYHLENPEINLTILVNREEDTAIISWNNKTTELKISGLFSVTDSAIFGLADLIKGDTPELYYSLSSGGTGALMTTFKIIDLETLEVVPISDFVNPMLNSLDIELYQLEDDVAVCRIESSSPSIIQYGSINVNKNTGARDCIYTPNMGSNYISIFVENNSLFAEVGFTLSNAVPGRYLGVIRGRLEYSIPNNRFEIQPSFTVELADKVSVA